MDAEYRINVFRGENPRTFDVTLHKVNIEPRGYIVASFQGRSLPTLIAKASAWITNDVTHPDPWCCACDRPQNDCACEQVLV